MLEPPLPPYAVTLSGEKESNLTDIAYLPAHKLAGKLRSREIGCLELLEHHLARVERFNPALNAIIWTDLEAARERAHQADQVLARGETWGPLHGLPMTIKESFDLAGAPTTWGIPELSGHIAKTDAVTTARLRAAGAIIFGKTNVPLMLADWQSFNAIYGTTNNPWDLTRTPGGSSGGSSAALAAGLCALELGSDIGASIRNPAHYCGVLGHKPSWGIVPLRGQSVSGALAMSDISVAGPLARTAEDLGLALSVLAGPDELDAAGWRLALPKPAEDEARRLPRGGDAGRSQLRRRFRIFRPAGGGRPRIAQARRHGLLRSAAGHRHDQRPCHLYPAAAGRDHGADSARRSSPIGKAARRSWRRRTTATRPGSPARRRSCIAIGWPPMRSARNCAGPGTPSSRIGMCC